MTITSNMNTAIFSDDPFNHIHRSESMELQDSTPEPEQDSDVMLGAYLMSHLRQHCENCGTFDTPQWRKGWFSDVLNHSVLLCNACGLKFHKGQFCPHCKYVYGKELKSPENWLNCDTCGRYVHRQCELKHSGIDFDQEASMESYSCPDCKTGVVPNYFQRIHLTSSAIDLPYQREKENAALNLLASSTPLSSSPAKHTISHSHAQKRPKKKSKKYQDEDYSDVDIESDRDGVTEDFMDIVDEQPRSPSHSFIKSEGNVPLHLQVPSSFSMN